MDVLTLLYVGIQFIGQFMTESVKVLERLASCEVPPISLAELEKMRNVLSNGESSEATKGEILKQLKVMEAPFRKRGNPKLWDSEVLDLIDGCFAEHFMFEGNIAEWLFLPNSEENQAHFMHYCGGVDIILATYPDKVPPHSREWFAYYSLWQVHGYAFPMPLGTSQVIAALESILRGYKSGFVEVSLL